MKILQFINSLTAGGAEKLLVDSVIEYHRNGISVDILVLKKTDSPFKSTLENYPEIKIIYLTETGSVYNPLHILKLNKIFRGYDLVHVHLFPSLYWASLSSTLFSYKGKLILTEHSTNNKRRNHKFLKLIDRIIYKKYDVIVAISRSAEDKLQKHLGNAFNNIRCINNGVKINNFKNAVPYNKTSLGLTENNKIIIQVSSFRYPKDQKTLIKAIKNLDFNTHLLLIGDGPKKQENIDLALQLGVEKRVHFLGVRSDVPELLKSSNIIVLSSHYEGLSLSSVEGMASGRPFLATNVPGLKEVVENAGILFNYEDEEGFVNAINLLLNDNQYYNNVVNSCLKRADEYTLEKMIANYTSLYNDLIIL
ncbi:glycosyltransferase [Zobellia amurskyensis]|uniref:Glycosyltransferase n=1 Tax=Zobellia amurskyensis TaxID=248905 RepID=A0A7X2ZV15_9FLAO|nr:glycosyltransferase [Zobellia amurskyensis]MUH36911.1 glycosyltransferase [Zobellia amurskyensis]